MQTAVYLLTHASILGMYQLTKAALMGSVDLIGIGTGLSKIDLNGLAIAKLRKEVEQLVRKMDVMLAAHSGVATQHLRAAIIKMDHQDISGAVKELEAVKTNAMMAFEHAGGQGGKKKENLKNGVFALQMKIFAEVLIQGYDEGENKITPFFLLDKKKKKMISDLVGADIENAKAFQRKHQDGWLTWNKEQKAQERQDILDTLLRTTYPLISEGRGLTTPFTPVKMPYNLQLLPEFLPEGLDDAAVITVGQLGGRPHNVRVWREGETAMADVEFHQLAASDRAGVTLSVTGLHIPVLVVLVLLVMFHSFTV